jgi:hypothetical protein
MEDKWIAFWVVIAFCLGVALLIGRLPLRLLRKRKRRR